MSIGPPVPELWLFFKIWPWNSKVKVMGEVTVQSHNVGLTSYHLTSLFSMSIGLPIPEIQHFQTLTLEIKGQGQMTLMLHNYRSRQFHRTSNGINPSSGSKDMGSQSLAQVLPDLTSCWPMGKPYGANGQITMTVHNYRSRQVHETLNGVNPSSGFRDMQSAKSGPNLWQIWKVFGPCAIPYEANGQMRIAVHNYRPRQFHRTSNGENPSSGYRDMGSASLAAARPTARPTARTVTTIPLQPVGLRVKSDRNKGTGIPALTSAETCGLDDVFPPDDLGSRPEALC